MEFLKLFLIVLALVGIGFVFLATRILFKRKGEFPDTHVGHNPNMKCKGITCVKTMDVMEQRKPNSYLQYKYKSKYKGFKLIKE